MLFQAVGSGSEFATYADVAEVLGRMDPGSSAILTSVWANGPRQGGHAYLAVNDNGRVYLEDPDTGERTPWPPPWGQDAVVRSAVAFLDAKGNATNPLQDTRQLVAAAAVATFRAIPTVRLVRRTRRSAGNTCRHRRTWRTRPWKSAGWIRTKSTSCAIRWV